MSILPQRFRVAVPTVPTRPGLVGTRKPEEICGVPTVPTCSDRKSQTLGEKQRPVSADVREIPLPAGIHDAPEADALAQHYAAPAEADAPAGRDPLAAGLLRGFYAHRQVQEPQPSQARTPRGEVCSCCAGTRWWQEARNPSGWRCWRCHPGDHLRPEEREERQG